MRLPRDVALQQLAKLLESLGYEKTRQTGSHVRLTRTTSDKQHHITIPSHNPIRVGTLSRILSNVAAHLGIEKDDLISKL
jgi:predicted RNA binding protein YcfA (HicA-like mRNA interferase family)